MTLALYELFIITVCLTIWNVGSFIFLVKGNVPKPKRPGEPLSICFLHPSLSKSGVSGSLIDLALNLRSQGHHVEFFTGYCSPESGFREAMDRMLDIHVHGSILPRSIAGQLEFFCLVFQFFFVSVRAMLRHKSLKDGFDLIVVGQFPQVLPLLRLSGTRVVYYSRSSIRLS